MGRRRMKTTRSGNRASSDRRMAATNDRSEYNEQLNQLGSRSGSNKTAAFSSSGILQVLDSSTLRTMPSESCNSEYVHDARKSTTDVSRIDKSSSFPQNKKSTTKPPVHPQPLRSSDQLSSGYRSAGQFQLPKNFSSCRINNQRGYCAPDARLNYRPNAKMWKVSDGSNMKGKCNIHGELEALDDLTRGPRGQRKKSVSDLPAVDKRMWLSVRRDQYNLEDFQTKYDNAKFYVIKSVSEDDTHKSIKYNVWSGTPYGNRKLDAAFHETQDETSEANTVCPIFLFHSVNGSGQFVGVAEMFGKVDFAKNLNFWQSEKWNGFFPVMWHIIKDIPNTQLRHIIIESKFKTPVTHSRDVQEIGLQQGLEMLKIFKNYPEKTSMLDDFNFYEKREQSLRAKRDKHASYSNRETQELLSRRKNREFSISRKP